MSPKDRLKGFAYLVPLALAALNGSAAAAQDGGCCAGPPCVSLTPGYGCFSCCNWHCPGPYVHCTPRVPCIKYKPTCGKPLCNLCDLEGYGYYPTCWRGWDQPLNYHCPVPTPTQLVHPPADGMVAPTDLTLPPPTRVPPAPDLPQR